ncbi:MAG: carbon-nitrogen hydrolase family protein [candidate division WS1 bacterium]|nr:carbon-nitrogen hydrolase family protein [candidate division WS1 bacterium]
MSRYVTVAGVSGLEPPPDRLLDEAAHYVWRAARMGADIVAFPEFYPLTGLSQQHWTAAAEEIPGATVTRMAEVAAANHCYVVWPLLERRGDKLYNTAVLIDRQGQVAGSYRKMYLTIGEMEMGIYPGTEATVLETDFGKIGMAICFDMNWRPVWEGLAENGAEIVFFCSMYRGSRQMQAWAFEFGYYLVSAVGSDLGQIVDQTGQVLKISHQDKVITHELNLNRRLLHMDFNWDKIDLMLEKYGSDLTFDFTAPEARFAVGCRRQGLTIDEIIQEFGLETLPQYWARVLKMRAERLAE